MEIITQEVIDTEVKDGVAIRLLDFKGLLSEFKESLYPYTFGSPYFELLLNEDIKYLQDRNYYINLLEDCVSQSYKYINSSFSSDNYYTECVNFVNDTAKKLKWYFEICDNFKELNCKSDCDLVSYYSSLLVKFFNVKSSIRVTFKYRLFSKFLTPINENNIDFCREIVLSTIYTNSISAKLCMSDLRRCVDFLSITSSSGNIQTSCKGYYGLNNEFFKFIKDLYKKLSSEYK